MSQMSTHLAEPSVDQQEPGLAPQPTRYVLWPDDTTDTGRLGGKARALAAMQAVGIPAPDWFVLASEAYTMSTGDWSAAPTGTHDAIQGEPCAAGPRDLPFAPPPPPP